MATTPRAHFPPSPAELTVLLRQAREGDSAASERLFSNVYQELHRLARAQLRAHGRPGATLETTALVHEAYLRLASPAGLTAEDRNHFFNLAARVMRHVMVDFARRRDAGKREGIRVDLTSVGELAAEAATSTADLVALDRALEELESNSPELARLVELRFFAGLPLEQITAILGRSERSLKRDWRRARAFLLARLGGAPLPAES